jgi:hypothetical protein
MLLVSRRRRYRGRIAGRPTQLVIVRSDQRSGHAELAGHLQRDAIHKSQLERDVGPEQALDRPLEFVEFPVAQRALRNDPQNHARLGLLQQLVFANDSGIHQPVGGQLPPP